MNILPINLDDLIHARSVESVRREFKKSWSDVTLVQVIRSISAFANDFHNLGGGYLILGIEESEGKPILPPYGIDNIDLDQVQKHIRGNCKRLDPEYQPVLSPELYMDKQILVIWVPAGDNRPYLSPKEQKSSDKEYYIRLGSETVEAKGANLTQLMQMTAKIPFDDRRNTAFTIGEISSTLVRKFLNNTKSRLIEDSSENNDEQLYESMRIVDTVHGTKFPRNVALLFFSNQPHKYFPGAKIDVVQFRDDAGGDLIEENTFTGPLDVQIRMALDYLNNLSTTMVKKVPGKAEALRLVAFPYEALEEALVNSVFHRSYEIDEPVKVYLYPDRMEITSYPGPMPGLKLSDLIELNRLPQIQNRNRRIGEFLKENRLAEARGTGIPKIRRRMTENGSPEPEFYFDEEKSLFRVTLPAHPQYIVLNSLRESGHLWATGERKAAIRNIEEAIRKVPKTGVLLAQYIEYKASVGDIYEMEQLYKYILDEKELTDKHLPLLSLAKYYLDNQNPKKASEILESISNPSEVNDVIELALLNKRAGRFKEAHSIFLYNFDLIKEEPKAVHEFAQTKMKLASNSRDSYTKKLLNREAVELLRRCVQLSDDDTRKAWCWFDLAKNLTWLRSPENEIITAYTKAMELLPNETRFHEQYKIWRENNKK